jgi:hypothetical protein
MAVSIVERTTIAPWSPCAAAASDLASSALGEVQAGLEDDPEDLPVYGSVLAEVRRLVHEVDRDAVPRAGTVR